MSNGKNVAPVALNDFIKSNGLSRSVHEVMPGGPSMCRQEFAADCDINTIMKRYEGQDIGAIMRQVAPVYYDFAEAPQTLLEFMAMQQDAEAAFMTLPASVRKEFENDPIQFVEFASDPGNLDQMRTWGLAKPAEKPQEPAPAPPAGGAAQGAAPPPKPA